jgi:uncharacterized membrane protein YccC
MKLLSIMTLALTLAVVAAAAAAQGQDDLDKAFQREYVYLSSQREALVRQRRQMDSSFNERISRLKHEVQQLQREVARLAAENDEQHERLTNLEKQKRELARGGSSIESTFKKASQTLAETEKALHFEVNREKVDPPLPEKPSLAALEPVFDRALSLLEDSGRMGSFEGTYMDENDRLAQGTITRLGRVAAFVDRQEGRYILGPNGAGGLKVLERADGAHVFFFDNLNEAARITKPATWLESLADFGPLLFLALMLVIVAGLFLALVKV